MKLQDIGQDLYPVLSDPQNCLSLAFTSSNQPKYPTYKAFQTSGAPGFASTLSARLENENRPPMLTQVSRHTDPQLCLRSHGHSHPGPSCCLCG
ncbi:hypothetical protein FIBSPDRAFT_880487 [Athelia psychrophila]|uniref:Uncharacterized protein n=1 Tax=Athelia psychrophila TaxID=1759441 RepID=A0A167STD5_9AGAM|nr:hypothetical protein FIBSPDRAFT_880487 [Fibularhizoctonia sp. CBS 109695]